MIDMRSKYDNMHKNGIFYALICINNHIVACVNYVLSIIGGRIAAKSSKIGHRLCCDVHLKKESI